MIDENCRVYCGKCRYWRELPNNNPYGGECRRHAPIVTFSTDPDHTSDTEWPLVRDVEWCGDGKTND